MTHTHYVVMVKGSFTLVSFWVPYIGEHTGIDDWWNYPPKRFTNKTSARNAIMADDLFKDSTWQIVKVTHSEEVVENHETEQL